MDAGSNKTAETLLKELVARLEQRGYTVHSDGEGAERTGKSGATHHFDMVATRNDGFMSYTIALDTAVSEDGNPLGLGSVFGFDDKCYDCGIRDKVVVALPSLDEVAERFAQNQHIRVFSREALEGFLALAPRSTMPESLSLTTWHSKTDVLGSLTERGYKIERGAKRDGRSGAEYTFDALATYDDGFVTHWLAIDEVPGPHVTLSRVSVFDAKAYDAGILEKILLTAGELTPEAKQFADLQRIRVISMRGEESTAERDTSAEQQYAPKHVTDSASGLPEGPELQTAVEEILGQSAGTGRIIRSRTDIAILNLIPESMARRFKAMPLSIKNDALLVAMANPSDIFALEALGLQSRMRIEPIAATEREVLEAVDMNYRGGFGDIQEQISRIPSHGDEMDEQSLLEAAEDTPVASALRLIVDEAAKARASDIHLEPQEDRLRVRYRVDGTLQEVMSLPLKIHLPLTSRVKILSDMNIADHLRPQDGQFSTEAKGREIDIRVATVPTVYGEATVMRLLDKSLGLIDLPHLGFSREALSQYQNMLNVAFGMILVSGPTGSGKTTTLYASINQMDRTSQKIITIEDPVEYRFPNINQIQVNPKAGLTFASGLRSILRLDPDTILVGEIRDGETARIAVQSALTGHLVLSSVHANDATGVVFRLLDLGIEPFLVSSSVIGVVAQRMARRVCPNCQVEREGTLLEQLSYHNETGEHRSKFTYGQGCDLCGHTGYKGRIGLFEVLAISDKLRMMILKGASTTEVRQQAMEDGMVPLMRDGMLKVKEGITTPSEVLRNTYFIE
ncbi:MAG: type II/IV secretion system protein [Dehalococcoidia bacterium]|nr:type II/IV secretion system protein [Dehalococcoidia bacterium]